MKTLIFYKCKFCDRITQFKKNIVEHIQIAHPDVLMEELFLEVNEMDDIFLGKDIHPDSKEEYQPTEEEIHNIEGDK